MKDADLMVGLTYFFVPILDGRHTLSIRPHPLQRPSSVLPIDVPPFVFEFLPNRHDRVALRATLLLESLRFLHRMPHIHAGDLFSAFWRSFAITLPPLEECVHVHYNAPIGLGILEAVHALEQTVVPLQFQTFVIPVREVDDARRLH